MIITLLGQADKQYILLPLLHVLSLEGDVAFITKDTSYMRLGEGIDSEKYFDNIDVFITQSSWEEVWEEIGHSPQDYVHIVYDMYGELPEGTEVFLNVKSIFETEDVEEIEYIKDKDSIVDCIYDKDLIPDASVVEAMLKTRAWGTYQPISNRRYCEAAAKVLYEVFLDYDKKQLMRMLSSKWR